MHDDIRVLDLTTAEKPTESVAIVYFKELSGTVHIYRDGTVMLSSPAGTTMTSLQKPAASLRRKTEFLHILTQLGASRHELSAAEEMIGVQEQRLQSLPFAVAVEEIAAASHQHFQQWCEQRGIDEAALDKDDPDDNKLLACALDGGADYLVTEDKDLHRLGAYRGIEIVNKQQFLQILDSVAKEPNLK